MRAVVVADQDLIVNGAEHGAPPMLDWIPIERLVIDDRYQREIGRGNWNIIKRIASEFHWSRFSPVFVAPSLGGKYAIIDGQHRTHAAALCGIEAVPCQIVQMDVEQQAASFAAINSVVTRVTPLQVYRAALAAGEKWALKAKTVCETAGCRLLTSHPSASDRKAGDIMSVSLIRGFVAKDKGKLITLGLSGLRRSEFGQTSAAYANEVLNPFLTAVSERPSLLQRQPDLAEFIDDLDIWTLLDKAAEDAMRSRRTGGDLTRYEIAAADIGAALDKAFPVRMALPASWGEVRHA